MTLQNIAEAALLFSALLTTGVPLYAQDAAKPAPEMQAVLDKLAALGTKPSSTLTVPEARTQPSPADASHAGQWDKRMSSNPEAQVTTKDIAIPSKEDGLAARIYVPGEKGPLLRKFGDDTPMGRPGQPSELASIDVQLRTMERAT